MTDAIFADSKANFPWPEKLLTTIKTIALEVKPEGEFFTLKSGAQSRYYLDLRKLHLHPTGLKMVVDMLWSEMSGLQFDSFGGPSVGADPIIGGMTYMCAFLPKGNRYRGFLIRPEVKDHGKTNRIVGKDFVQGERCVIIEDVVTSGQSSLEAIDVVEGLGAKVVQVFCVVDRLQGGAERFAERGLPYKSLFTIKDLGYE